jgi:DNA-binding transcriptional regulator YiaG
MAPDDGASPSCKSGQDSPGTTPLLGQRWTVGQKCSNIMRAGAARWRRFEIVSAMNNLVSGRQIRAARMLAGLTQDELARETGCHPRSVRYWESKDTDAPTNVASTLKSIEQALNRHGVMAFSTPSPGVRLL